MVKGIDIEFRKKKKEEDGTTTRKKRKRDKMEEPPIAPVPFKKLDTPHAIDCMHLEKNVFESTIGILLDIKTKTKDGLKSRWILSTRTLDPKFTRHWRHSARKLTFRARATT